ncbi:hypothetical protein L484_017648 [Morus notabilis]|uniref:Uncharacterized protein n=1 Tax=Morus notabilis TaxID=981085 RepID=W9SGH7_9ROSA|nr:hypothetical protein L484_017648 [Morus notabilis]
MRLQSSGYALPIPRQCASKLKHCASILQAMLLQQSSCALVLLCTHHVPSPCLCALFSLLTIVVSTPKSVPSSPS